VNAVSALITVAGIFGTLGGVVVGAWLTNRNDRWLLEERHHREDRQARINACIEFLAVFRQFRTFVLTHDLKVVIQPSAMPGREVAFIKDAPAYTDAVQRVIGQLRLLEGGQTAIVAASADVQEASRQIVLARSKRWPKALPAELVEQARKAEREFIRIAHRELGMSNQPESSAP
jgi:hypothetical protein